MEAGAHSFGVQVATASALDVAGMERAIEAFAHEPNGRGQPMSTEDDREKRREESPEWHRARAKSLREHGFTKMAQEHEQIAEMIERRRREQENK